MKTEKNNKKNPCSAELDLSLFVFHSVWKYLLTIGMLQVNKIKIREESC